MNKKLKTVMASALLLSCMVIPAKAAYYVYGNGGDYEGKLNLYMDGNTRYGLAGTYVQDDKYIVNTISAEVIDNGVSKAYKSVPMDSKATTKTVVVNYNGVVGKHKIVSPSHGNWSAST